MKHLSSVSSRALASKEKEEVYEVPRVIVVLVRLRWDSRLQNLGLAPKLN